MKIVCVFKVVVDAEYCNLEYADNVKAWLWLALDCSDGEPQVQKLALRFASTELAMEFRDVFEYVAIFGCGLQRHRHWNEQVHCHLSCDTECANIFSFSVDVGSLTPRRPDNMFN